MSNSQTYSTKILGYIIDNHTQPFLSQDLQAIKNLGIERLGTRLIIDIRTQVHCHIYYEVAREPVEYSCPVSELGIRVQG